MDLRTWTESSKGDKKRGGEGGSRYSKDNPSLWLMHTRKLRYIYIDWAKMGSTGHKKPFPFSWEKNTNLQMLPTKLNHQPPHPPPLMHDLIVTMKPNNILVGKLKHVVRFPTSW